jgi:hypothetical protein
MAMNDDDNDNDDKHILCFFAVCAWYEIDGGWMCVLSPKLLDDWMKLYIGGAHQNCLDKIHSNIHSSVTAATLHVGGIN